MTTHGILGFTWRDIRDHAINVCGQTSEAVDEFYHLATAAFRELASGVDVAELEVEGDKAIVPVGKDRIGFPLNVYAIHSIFNLTTQERVEPEEDGQHGRTRYLESTGLPPTGTVYRYVRMGKYILLRDTAEEETTLALNYKLIPPDVTKETLDSRPLTPPHLDWAIIWMIGGVYYDLHPPKRMTEDIASQLAPGESSLAEHYVNRAWKLAKVEAKRPRSYESRDKRNRMTGWGYSASRFG